MTGWNRLVIFTFMDTWFCFSVCGTFILAWKIPAPGSYLLNSLETDLLKNRGDALCAPAAR